MVTFAEERIDGKSFGQHRDRHIVQFRSGRGSCVALIRLSAGLVMVTSNIDSEAATAKEASALDLKLDAMASLLWPCKLAVDDITVRPRIRGWREKEAAEGERWLRRSAEEGDCCAMEALGLRLINGDGLQRNPEEGLEWLRRAADSGSPIAMARFAECLLDHEPSSPESRKEAEDWLEKAIHHGNLHAAVMLGTRLITGSVLPADPERGRRLLVQAAEGGSQIAHIKLGVYLLSGRGLAQDKEEGFSWLRRVGCLQPSQLQFLNFHLYMKSLAAPTRGEKRLLAEEAGVLFYESVQQGNSGDELNLAYLIRRGEIDAAPYPPLDTLLALHLRDNHPSALINQALRLAKGVGCEVDWQLADILVGKIERAGEILQWWFARSTQGDAEGHLVTGWLVRRELALDPEQREVVQRMDLARAGGWEVPDWMGQQASR